MTRRMLYVDPTTRTDLAAADVVDASRDRYADRAPILVGSRYRIDADTVGTVVRVLTWNGHAAAVTVETDAGIRVRVDIDATDVTRPPITLADSIDAVRASRETREMERREEARSARRREEAEATVAAWYARHYLDTDTGASSDAATDTTRENAND